MKKMKLMDLARLAYNAPIGKVIDFENSGFWCGIKRIDEFDKDNMQFLIGVYGGQADSRLYHIDEWDARIGDFCCQRLRFPVEEIDYVECIAKALADFILDYDGSVSSVIMVDDE